MRSIAAAALLLALAAPANAGNLGVPHFGGDVRNSGINDPNLVIQPGAVTAGKMATGAAAGNLGYAPAHPGANGDILGFTGLAAPLATTPGSIMGTGFTPTGVPAGYTETMAQVAVQSGVLVDTLKSVVDADDTMSFQRGCANGLALLGGARTYLVHDFQALNSACPTFVFRGIPGLTVVKRVSGTSGIFFDVRSSRVYIDGVIFDGNNPTVSTNQAGVVFDGSANGTSQTIAFLNSKVMNTSGALGVCVAVRGTGPTGGGSFSIQGDEFTACSASPVSLPSAYNGDVSRNYFHDNASGPSVFATVNGTVSSTNYASTIDVHDNRFAREYSGVTAGVYSKPYSLSTMPTQYIRVHDNDFLDITNYGTVLQGYDNAAYNNNYSNSSPTVTTFGAIEALCVRCQIIKNKVNFQNVPWGIDTGGSIDTQTNENQISMNSGILLNIGASTNSDALYNHLSATGTAIAVNLSGYESDGSGPLGGMAVLTSNTRLQYSTITVDGTQAFGVYMPNDPGGAPGAKPIIVTDNSFLATNGAPNANLIWWHGGTGHVLIDRNPVNGTTNTFINPVSGNIYFDYVNVGGTISDNTGIPPVGLIGIIPRDLATYVTRDSIPYVDIISGGSGYTAAVTVTPSAGCTWTGAPLTNNGVLTGILTTGAGTGCAGATLTVSDTGGGSGAVISPAFITGIPTNVTIKYVSRTTRYLQTGGGGMGLIPPVPLEMAQNSEITLLSDPYGLSSWHVLNAFPPTFASTSLPSCVAGNSGAIINVSGSASGKWSAQCNGTNWLYPDGTSAP